MTLLRTILCRPVLLPVVAFLVATMGALQGCRDPRIREGDPPQIIALKKSGAEVQYALTGGYYIDLKDSGIDDDDLLPLAELPTVQSLDLSGTDVTDEGLQHIVAGPKDLPTLQLDGTSITDAAIEVLKGLPNLTNLSLTGTAITDKGLAMLPECLPNLRSLTLNDCQGISNDCPRSVAKLERLQALSLANCRQISGDGLEHLRDKKSFQSIYLFNTGCSNASVQKLAEATRAQFVVNAEGKPAGALAKLLSR
jgi:hypothetical protein